MPGSGRPQWLLNTPAGDDHAVTFHTNRTTAGKDGSVPCAFGSDPEELMIRRLLKSKIHRATVTEADLNYEGSITIDERLMQAAGIVEYEQVDVYDITNGSRLTTYAIRGEPGSGVICLNGAAARCVHVGDLIIIVSYADFHEDEVPHHSPVIIVVDEHNVPRSG